MTNNSSISSFKASGEEEVGPSVLLRRLAIFISPLVAIGVAGTLLVALTGEILPARWIAWAQTKHHQFIYLPKLSDHSFYLKLQAARFERPDVLVLGSSRANQWRSAMFAPYSFYNSGNAVDPLSDFSRFLEEMGSPFPKVIIFSLDFFTFNNAWAARFANLAHGDIRRGEYPVILQKLIDETRANRAVFQAPIDPVYRVPAIGLTASRYGIGFRIDGSFQYGFSFQNGPISAVDVARGIERVTQGEEPFLFHPGLDAEQLHELEHFAALARQNSIALVAVTMPFPRAEIEAVEQSNRLGIWKEFEQQSFKDWVAKQGILYFDFTHTESFDGNEGEFVDAFHPTETAYVRMLLSMLKDTRFKTLLPEIGEANLTNRLQTATTHEVFKNEF